MSENKKVLEIDGYEQGVIINALNDFRSDLIKDKRATDIVDEVLIKTIDAKEKKKSLFKKEKKCQHEAR